jgi:putative hydrolase of the HAD superfamily
MVWNNEVSKELIRGRISREEWWNGVQSLNPVLLGTPQSFIWKDVFGGSENIDSDVLKYVNELNDKYTTAILTNADKLSAALIKHQIGNTKFDYILSSSDLGSLKPEKEIYLKTLEILKIKPIETIFFDDRRKNVDGAIEVGIHAFYYEGLIKMKRTIDGFFN